MFDWLDDLVGNMEFDAPSAGSWEPSGLDSSGLDFSGGDFLGDAPMAGSWLAESSPIESYNMFNGLGDAPMAGSWMSGGEAEVPSFGGFEAAPTDSRGNYGDSAYGGYAVPNAAPAASFMDTLDKYGQMLSTPGGKLLLGLGGAGVSALGAMKQNKLMKDAYKKQQEMLAQRKSEAQRFNEPLRLSFNRQAVANPENRRGETSFFTENKLPSYFAEGGRVDSPSALGFIKYMLAGKKLPSDIASEKEARRQALLQTTEPSLEAGLVKALNRKEALEQQERAAGLACGGQIHGYVKGGDSGQADTIPARLSAGEWVGDADFVSALGDGNNEAGAAKLDQLRQSVRAHKRSAPNSKIPPKAKSPLAYMAQKGAK